MGQDQFGTVDDYFRAFEFVLHEGIPDKHLDLLRAHFDAPNHTATANELAKAVGDTSYRAVNLQYGTLAGRVAERLGIIQKPNGFWFSVLADWDEEQPAGDTRFVLRKPVIEALLRLGLVAH